MAQFERLLCPFVGCYHSFKFKDDKTKSTARFAARKHRFYQHAGHDKLDSPFQIKPWEYDAEE